jgi:hypothetical protein
MTFVFDSLSVFFHSDEFILFSIGVGFGLVLLLVARAIRNGHDFSDDKEAKQLLQDQVMETGPFTRSL